jgi:hypothetical protein
MGTPVNFGGLAVIVKLNFWKSWDHKKSFILIAKEFGCWRGTQYSCIRGQIYLYNYFLRPKVLPLQHCVRLCKNICAHALHIMLRDELTQKFSHFDKITVFGYPRACKFRKPHQTNQFWSLRLPPFFKTWFLLHKMWQKLAKTFFLKKSHSLLYSF